MNLCHHWITTSRGWGLILSAFCHLLTSSIGHWADTAARRKVHVVLPDWCWQLTKLDLTPSLPLGVQTEKKILPNRCATCLPSSLLQCSVLQTSEEGIEREDDHVSSCPPPSFSLSLCLSVVHLFGSAASSLHNASLKAPAGLVWFHNALCTLYCTCNESDRYLQGWAKEMEPSWEKVSAQLQPATAGHARLVLSKTVLFFCTNLYSPFKKNIYKVSVLNCHILRSSPILPVRKAETL